MNLSTKLRPRFSRYRAGPSGLAVAAYGASEGLDVLVLEINFPGGQTGFSSKFEIIWGFQQDFRQELEPREYHQAQSSVRISLYQG